MGRKEKQVLKLGQKFVQYGMLKNGVGQLDFIQVAVKKLRGFEIRGHDETVV